MKINEQKLKDWMAGEVENDELTDAEVKYLERRVFDAIAKKMLANPGKITFAQHTTVQ